MIRTGLLILALMAGTALAQDEKSDWLADGSLEELQKRADDLKVEKVGWRKIEWRTCLLEALKESREKNKPIILWVFIDRPINDERC